VQRIFFCTGSTFFTGDAIAAVVMDYALALGELRRFDTVDLPVRRLDGSEGRATLLLSPVSQSSSESVDTDMQEVLDADLVERIHASAERLRDPLVVAPPFAEWDEDAVAGA
jgi:hypothetical protein